MHSGNFILPASENLKILGHICISLIYYQLPYLILLNIRFVEKPITFLGFIVNFKNAIAFRTANTTGKNLV